MPEMKNLLCAGLLLVASFSAIAQSSPVMELQAGFHRIEAEVVNTPQSRAQGLMHRREMAPQHGMLFIFTEDNQHCMWMKNTLIPLAVAFIDEGGRILNIEEMKPQSEANHCAVRPARYALEMNAGWFSQRGLKRGDVIGGIERAPKPH
jgi:uncharacterized membrane protein (UPF0127 family)